MKNFLLAFALILLFFSCGGATEESGEDTKGNTGDSVENMDESVEEEVVIDINLKEVTNYPEDCELKGHLENAYSWSDKNGTNYFFRTINEIEYEEDEWGLVGTRYLWAFHYVEKTDGSVELLKETTDFVKGCEFDLNMGHIHESIKLTDLDEDDIAEISFIYRMTCTSDVSPSTQKLIMLEDGNKYPLRGNTEVMGYGGEYEVGEEFDSAPSSFLDHADELWNAHRTEYDDMMGE